MRNTGQYEAAAAQQQAELRALIQEHNRARARAAIGNAVASLIGTIVMLAVAFALFVGSGVVAAVVNGMVAP
jgi:uncharacterized membrane protein